MKKQNFFLNMFDILGINVSKVNDAKKKRRRKKEKPVSSINSEQISLFSTSKNSSTKPITKFQNNSIGKSSKLNSSKHCSLFESPEENKKLTDKEKQSPQVKFITSASNKVKKLYKNYRISFSDKLGRGNFKEKCKGNIDAIRLERYLTKNNISPSEVQCKKLVKYIGWGGLSKIFDEKAAEEYSPFNKQLKELLSIDEYNKARRSTLTAFYTPVEVIKFIYDVLKKLGFSGGRILEPSCGIGHFIGLLPQNLISRTKVTAVELDPISYNIAKLLYPNAEIINKAFEKTKFKPGSFDLVIGNIPFGDIVIADPDYKKFHLRIHNYFLMKSLDLLREGGILAVITTHFTMDAKDSKFRDYLKKNAELLGAVRLPSNTFSKSANTETVSDILFFQKKHIDSYHVLVWDKSSKTKEGFYINDYFINNPKMVLGTFKAKTNQFGNIDFQVEHKSNDLSKGLSSLLKYFERDAYSEISQDLSYLFEYEDLIPASESNIKEYSFEIIDNGIFQKQGEYFVPVVVEPKNEDRFNRFIELKNSLLDLIDYQKNDDDNTDLEKFQNILKIKYDSFVFKYKSINSRENKKLFSEDPFFPLVSSLEKIDEETGEVSKAEIFYKRTISNKKEIAHTDNINDALAVSINLKGKINFDLISRIIGKNKVKIICELLNKKLIFKNPENMLYETREEYLSGNIFKKIEQIKLYMSSHSKINEFKYNLGELVKSKPAYIPYEDINIELGASWVDTQYIKDFIIHLLSVDHSSIKDLKVIYSKFNSLWELVNHGIKLSNYKNNTEYGTEMVSAITLIEKSLNLQQISIYDIEYDSVKERDIRVFNVKETTFARQKQQEIKDAFKSWIWKDEGRRKYLADKYNRLFNSWVNRKYDGSKLKLYNISSLAPSLRDYQKNAVYRELYGGNTLLAHAVGAGKTFEMIAAGMEMKRLGICNKPMYVIPNSLIESGQFARDFMQLYPTANILVATKKDFSADSRKRFISKIALGEWDAVLISHSSFGLIPVSNEYKIKFIQKQVDEIANAILNLEKEDSSLSWSRTVKKMEKIKQNLEAKIENITENMRKDNFLCFEQLGIDQLFIDEAHRFKNLFLYTKLSRIPGATNIASQKAEDLFIKSRYVLEKNNWKRGIVFATGTPISNSVGEMYTMMRYLMPKRLEELSLDYFDSWAGTFGEIISSVEVDPTGSKYRSKLRFSKFHNVPELVSIFKEFADIITDDMLNIPGKPELENQEYIIREIEKCPEVEEYISELVERANEISNGNVDPSEDNMLCVTNDGRKAALDPRLVGINADYPESKINTCVDDVFNEWQEGSSERTTHLIFCDLGTPKKKKAISNTLLKNNIFDVYFDIKKKLILKGISQDEIAFIHDANTDSQKNELFKKFNNGSIRILIGSTAKCGEGCNLQNRLKSMHHLDVPWKPNELIQREGRILRVGNINPSVRVYRYATKGTFDSYSWQTVERKAAFIAQVMRGDFTGREMADIDIQLMSFSEMKAACSENPIIQKRIKNANRINELSMLKNSFIRQQASSERNLQENREYIKEAKLFLDNLKVDLDTYNINKQKNPLIIKESQFTSESKAGEYLLKLFDTIDELKKPVVVGEIYSFEISLLKDKRTFSNELVKYVIINGHNPYRISWDESIGGLALLNKIYKVFNSFESKISEISYEIKSKEESNIGYMDNIKQSFKFENELETLKKEQIEIDIKLNIKNNENEITA